MKHLKQFERRGREWLWPADDEKLIQVFDQVDDVDVILQHVPTQRRGLCVQAGGACGVWPAKLAEHFETVITLEPSRDNYECLVANTARCGNVIAINAALGSQPGRAALVLHDSEAGNAGAIYTSSNPTGMVQILTIDMLVAAAVCDLVLLDVEGAELDALKGAAGAIAKGRPVIVAEQKDLPQKPVADNDAGEYLGKNFSYKEVGRVHRDVIYKW